MSDATEYMKSVDTSTFNTEAYVKRVEKPWGYELHLTHDQPYMAKIMHVKAGTRMSMQVHDSKTETYTVHTGRAGLIVEGADGQLHEIELEPGKGYTTQVGQRHRLFGITDCDIFEASSPETGTTWRLEDDYSRPDETESMRAEPNRGYGG